VVANVVRSRLVRCEFFTNDSEMRFIGC
jgi:hypothetical protein